MYCKSFLIGCSFLLAGLAAIGCGNAGSGKPLVGIVSNNSATFWSIAEVGAKDAAKKYTNVQVQFLKPDKGTAEQQKTMIDDLLGQNAQAVAVSVINPKNQTPYFNRSFKNPPFLLTQDNDAPDSKRYCYIGTDNYTAGWAVGEMVKDVLPAGGTIAIFVGQIAPINAQQRRQGVIDALAGNKDANVSGADLEKVTKGKFKIHGLGASKEPYTDNVKPEKAKQNADDVLGELSAGKDLNLCMVGLWAYNPPAIFQAVKGAKRLGEVKIVGFDEDETTLEGIKQGHIYGTVVQQPYKFGYECVRVMSHLIKGDTSVVPADKKGLLYVPHRVIKRDNVDDFQKELHKLIGK